MQNFDGAMNPFKIPLNADGRVVMLADPSLTYDVYIKNSYGDLVCSRLNVECISPGNISINGADTRINNTDGTLDISLRTLGNNVRQYTVNTHNKVLDVQAPLYFVENSNTATIIGVRSGGGQGGDGDPEVNALVHANSATWNDVSAKLNTTAFSTVSGNFLTAIPDEYSTKDYVQSSVSSKLDSTAFSTVSGSFLTAHQDISTLMPKSESANFYPMTGNPSGFLTAHQDLSNKLDTTAFSDVSGNFLTAVDLTPYQTVEGMTAYQPIGDYADATALDGKVDTSSFTAFSSTTNEKIEYISGALSGTYELSAGEGIDITDYPNEQKTLISVTAQGGNPEVSHDNTLSGNGTVDSPLSVVPGYNETVLWSGTQRYDNFPLTENPYNFEYIKIYGSWQQPELSVNEILINNAKNTSNKFMIGGFAGDKESNSYVYVRDTWYRVNNSGFNFSAYKASETVIIGTQISRQNDSSAAYKTINKIVGINRIANN